MRQQPQEETLDLEPLILIEEDDELVLNEPLILEIEDEVPALVAHARGTDEGHGPLMRGALICLRLGMLVVIVQLLFVFSQVEGADARHKKYARPKVRYVMETAPARTLLAYRDRIMAWARKEIRTYE